MNLNLNPASSDQQLGVFQSRPAVAADIERNTNNIERTTNNFQRTTPRPAPPLRVTQVYFDHLRFLTLVPLVPVLFVYNCQWLKLHRKNQQHILCTFTGRHTRASNPKPNSKSSDQQLQ